MPPFILAKLDQSHRIEALPGSVRGTLLFLAEMVAIDDAIDQLIAKVGVDCLNQGMLFNHDTIGGDVARLTSS